MTFEQLAPVILPGLLFVLAVDDVIHAHGFWQQYRDSRSFRNFLLVLVVALGIAALFLRSVAFYLLPELGDFVRFLGFIAYGGIAVVLVFRAYSWRRP